MRSMVRCSLIALLAGAAACTNYDLLDKLENPGGKEVFTDRLYIFVTSQMTAGDMFALTAVVQRYRYRQGRLCLPGAGGTEWQTAIGLE
jgi:hypothetical protein